MWPSLFSLFKIGIGPSSSHTMGPMVAARMFLDEVLATEGGSPAVVAPARIRCSLHGSLAFTGKGHATDRAVILGLAGVSPERADPDECDRIEKRVRTTETISLPGFPDIRFLPDTDILFDVVNPLNGHPNSLRFLALDCQGGILHARTYHSVGGGFVRREGDADDGPDDGPEPPYPFRSAAEMLSMNGESGLSIAAMMRANERSRVSESELDRRIDEIWSAMDRCIERGLSADGTLPGELRVKRRAPTLARALVSEAGRNDVPPHRINDWLLLYAMAVNEENANGGRVVTAPTNGAAGVVPAVIRYATEHVPGGGPERIRTMLLTAAAIGGIVKRNASISGAEVGCQGEVGSASAMAAAALAAALGGTAAQIENAAEIALEHHLGMTCDPVAGLVQIPCIERNGIGAVKAVAAASLALHGDGTHYVSLDACVEAMRQTGLDMSDKYKETSTGGLAVNVVAC